jgi:hypothetical protein
VGAPIEGGRLIEVERGLGVEREVGLGRCTGGAERGWAGGQFEVTEDGYELLTDAGIELDGLRDMIAMLEEAESWFEE